MQRLSHHLKSHPKPSSTPSSSPSLTLPPSFYDGQDIFRYRKQRGVNLGSWFVLERWIADAPFRNAAQPAQSDLDIARGKNARAILEEHWNAWITEDDWAWLKERGFNSVRIPIGYYHLAGLDSSLLEGTDFHGLEDVFINAWAKIEEAFELAYKYRMGVLIDLHAAPGKQNADSHSGTSNKPTFFSKRNLRHTTHILCTLLTRLLHFLHTHDPPLPNLIGIELLNEPHPPSDQLLQSWYTTTIHDLRLIDPTIPLYLGECWRTDSYAHWLSSQDPESKGLIALDHHLYRCFTSADIHTPAKVHIANLDPNTNSPVTQHFSSISEQLGNVPGGGAGFVIGEWSGALNPASLSSNSPSRGLEETKSYIDTQIRLYDKTCAGWFFWTFKKQQPGDFGWSLRDAVGAGTFPSRVGLRLTTADAVVNPKEITRAKTAAKEIATGKHKQWWAQYPGHYEHWRFDEGYDKGWDDAFRFFMFDMSTTSSGSITELGFTRAWVARRRTGGNNHGGGGNFWEFEHGFLQGVDGAREIFKDRYGR